MGDAPVSNVCGIPDVLQNGRIDLHEGLVVANCGWAGANEISHPSQMAVQVCGTAMQSSSGGYDNVAELKEAMLASASSKSAIVSQNDSEVTPTTVTARSELTTVAHGIQDAPSDAGAVCESKAELGVKRSVHTDAGPCRQLDSSPMAVQIDAGSGVGAAKKNLLTVDACSENECTENGPRCAETKSSSESLGKKATKIVTFDATAEKSEKSKTSLAIDCKDKPPTGKAGSDSGKKSEKLQEKLEKRRDQKEGTAPKTSFFKAILARSRSPSPKRGSSNRSPSPSALRSTGSEIARRLSEPLKSSFRQPGGDVPRMICNQRRDDSLDVEVSVCSESSELEPQNVAGRDIQPSSRIAESAVEVEVHKKVDDVDTSKASLIQNQCCADRTSSECNTFPPCVEVVSVEGQAQSPASIVNASSARTMSTSHQTHPFMSANQSQSSSTLERQLRSTPEQSPARLYPGQSQSVIPAVSQSQRSNDLELSTKLPVSSKQSQSNVTGETKGVVLDSANRSCRNSAEASRLIRSSRDEGFRVGATTDFENPWRINMKDIDLKPNLENFKGEKLFRKDTVTTNVPVVSLAGFELSKSNCSLNSFPAAKGGGHLANNKTISMSTEKLGTSAKVDCSGKMAESPIYDTVYDDSSCSGQLSNISSRETNLKQKPAKIDLNGKSSSLCDLKTASCDLAQARTDGNRSVNKPTLPDCKGKLVSPIAVDVLQESNFEKPKVTKSVKFKDQFAGALNGDSFRYHISQRTEDEYGLGGERDTLNGTGNKLPSSWLGHPSNATRLSSKSSLQLSLNGFGGSTSRQEHLKLEKSISLPVNTEIPARSTVVADKRSTNSELCEVSFDSDDYFDDLTPSQADLRSVYERQKAERLQEEMVAERERQRLGNICRMWNDLELELGTIPEDPSRNPYRNDVRNIRATTGPSRRVPASGMNSRTRSNEALDVRIYPEHGGRSGGDQATNRNEPQMLSERLFNSGDNGSSVDRWETLLRSRRLQLLNARGMIPLL